MPRPCIGSAVVGLLAPFAPTREYIVTLDLGPAPNARADPTVQLPAGTFTAEELLYRSCSLVYAATGSYQETARHLGLDRRTVRSKVAPALASAFGRTGG